MSPPKLHPAPLLFLQHAQKDCITAGPDDRLASPWRAPHWAHKWLMTSSYRYISAVLYFCDRRRQVQCLTRCNLMNMCCSLRCSTVCCAQRLMSCREINNVVTEQRTIHRQTQETKHYTTAWRIFWTTDGITVCAWDNIAYFRSAVTQWITNGTAHVPQSHAIQYM